MNFHQKTLRQIKLWAWAASVLPTMSLAALFFIRVLGLENLYYQLLVIGAVFMFGTAVVWWWWAIFTIKYLITVLTRTSKNLQEASIELSEISTEVKQLKNDI